MREAKRAHDIQTAELTSIKYDNTVHGVLSIVGDDRQGFIKFKCVCDVESYVPLKSDVLNRLVVCTACNRRFFMGCRLEMIDVIYPPPDSGVLTTLIDHPGVIANRPPEPPPLRVINEAGEKPKERKSLFPSIFGKGYGSK